MQSKDHDLLLPIIESNGKQRTRDREEKKPLCTKSHTWVLIVFGLKWSLLCQFPKNYFHCKLQLFNMTSAAWKRWFNAAGRGWTVVRWLFLHTKFLFLRMTALFWGGKDNHFKITDRSGVAECSRKHQSHLQWITNTSANARHAERTKMDPRRQTNPPVIFCQWEGEQFSRFTFTLIGKQMIKAAEIFRLDKLRGSRGQCALNLFKFCSSCDVCVLLNPGWNNFRLNKTFYSFKKIKK